MFWTRVIISVIEFLLSFFLAVFTVFWSYKSFDHFNKGFRAQEEIYKGNVAVAVVMAAMMYGVALIMRESIYPVIGTITVALTSGAESGYSYLTLAGYIIGHLTLGFLLAVGCVQVALKTFQILNSEINEPVEIGKGNTAVAVIVAAVVLVVSTFMRQGVGALTKSMIPQPKIGVLSVLGDADSDEGELSGEELSEADLRELELPDMKIPDIDSPEPSE